MKEVPKLAQDILAVIVPMLFASLVLVFSGVRLYNSQPLFAACGIVFVGCYLFGLFLESKISVKISKIERDTRSFIFHAFRETLSVLTLLVSLALPSQWQELNEWMALGFILLISGMGFRLYSLHSLSSALSGTLVQKGPYYYLRHPASMGLITWHLGFVLYFMNETAIYFLIFGFIPSVILCLLHEEKKLFQMPGYSDYAFTRKRIFPKIW